MHLYYLHYISVNRKCNSSSSPHMTKSMNDHDSHSISLFFGYFQIVKFWWATCGNTSQHRASFPKAAAGFMWLCCWAVGTMAPALHHPPTIELSALDNPLPPGGAAGAGTRTNTEPAITLVRSTWVLFLLSLQGHARAWEPNSAAAFCGRPHK